MELLNDSLDQELFNVTFSSLYENGYTYFTNKALAELHHEVLKNMNFSVRLITEKVGRKNYYKLVFVD